MKLNIPLLRQIQRYVITNPERLNMDAVHAYRENGEHCGCIAGLGAAFATQGVQSTDWQKECSTLFGITYEEGQRLFFWTEWPIKFQIQYLKGLGDTAKQAEAACARINALIEEHEKEQPSPPLVVEESQYAYA